VKGAEVQVVNAGSAAVLLTSWKVDTFTSRSTGQLAGRAATSISGGLRVPARSRAVLVFEIDSATAAAAAPGRYQSMLTVSYGTGEAEVQIIATKPKPPPTAAPSTNSTIPAKALTGELTVQARRGSPGEFTNVVYIPARQGTEVRRETFVLTSEGVPPALARLDTVRSWEAEPLLREYPLTVRHLRGGRSYKGKIILGTDSTASAVSLTVNASHHWFFFALAVLAGVLGGLLVRRWTDLGRPINLLRERVLRALPVFKSTLKKHTDAGWPANILESEFTTLQEATAVRVRSLTPYIVKNEEVEKEFTAVRVAVEAFEAKTRALAAVTTELQALKTVRDTVAAGMQGVLPPHGSEGVLPPSPVVLSTVADTLAGTHLTLGTLEAAGTDIAAQRAYLGNWAKVFQDALAKRDWLGQLGEPRAGEEEALKTADRQLEGVVLWDLWKVQVNGPLDAAANSLAEVESILRRIAYDREKRKRKPFATVSGEESTPQIQHWVSEADASRALPATEAAQLSLAQRLLWRRWLNDLGLGAGAFLVALLTTLSKEYFGSPFGTLEDYLSVLTWAFGLTATLTLLTSGLASLQSISLRPLLRR
jgi:hypothetical protein